MKKSKTISLPSVLAFERKLEVSDGLMYAGNFENRNVEYKEDDNKKEYKLWKEIRITPRKNRSTQSACGITDANKIEANLVASGADQAVIPSGCDTLKVSWTMRVIGNVGKPFSCNDADFEKVIVGKTSEFKEQGGIKDLAFRYAYNIANGRFLWRNRVCAEAVEIQVSIKGKNDPLIFNAYEFSLLNFDKNKTDENLNKVVDIILEGLKDTTGEKFSSIKVAAFVKLDESQQIFPSQEMNINENKKGKALFQLNNCAAMHNVKIGNAIRTIDTWYGNNAIAKSEGKNKTKSIEVTDKHPIAIEPYGSVTQRGIAYRPEDNDLYTLMKRWIKDEELTSEELTPEDKAYVMANLIRGGVFGEKEKK